MNGNRELLYTLSIFASGLLLLYAISKKVPILPIPRERPTEPLPPSAPRLEIEPIYPKPNQEVFHAFTRQEIAIAIRNLSNIDVEVFSTGYLKVDNKINRLPTKMLIFKPNEAKIVRYIVDFPFVLPFQRKEATVNITISDRVGNKIAEKVWNFYIKGTPL